MYITTERGGGGGGSWCAPLCTLKENAWKLTWNNPWDPWSSQIVEDNGTRTLKYLVYIYFREILAYTDKFFFKLAKTEIPIMTILHPLRWPWRNVFADILGLYLQPKLTTKSPCYNTHVFYTNYFIILLVLKTLGSLSHCGFWRVWNLSESKEHHPEILHSNANLHL